MLVSFLNGFDMTIKERVLLEINKLPDEKLEELYGLLKSFEESDGKKSGESFMSKLRRIKIQGPPDFAENFDAYLNGEKSIE